MIQAFLWAPQRAKIATQVMLASPPPHITMLPDQRPRLSIHRHPDDIRRTVICGRFAEVCAALEGLAAAEPDGYSAA
jgi:hypothetical protein